MSWYYSKSGTQFGPVAEEELAAKCKSGDVVAADLVWKEGMVDWKQAGQVPELGAVSAPASAPPPILQGNATLPQPSAVAFGQHQHVPNYLWQAIVATCICCVPFGVVGIVYAAKVDGLAARGDIAGAKAAASSAKLWTNLAAGCGALVYLLSFLLLILGAANA